MKTKFLAVMLALTGLESWAQTPPGLPSLPTRTRPPRYTANVITNSAASPTTQPRYTAPQNGSSAAPTDTAGNSTAPDGPAANAPSAAASAADLEMLPAGTINFQSADLNQVLEIYSKYVGRTLLRGNVGDAKVILKTVTPLTRREVIEALQAVLALNNVSVVNVGEKFVKVVPSAEAATAAGELDRRKAEDLPNLGSYLTHVVQLRYVKPSEMLPVIDPFSKLKSNLAIDVNGILIIRDYAENVKRMLEMIEQIDISIPAEYISEVIPIRYAKVDEIAAALNSLGGSGGGSPVSIGTAPSSGTISGFGSRSSGISGVNSGGGIGGGGYQQNGGIGGNSAFGGNRNGLGVGGGANPNGNPAGGTSFQQRLQNIVNRASSPTGGGGGGGQDQIQLFGQTKIIPNESSSTLLIYATRQDMVMIKEIIGKLDVPLAQVLIEAIIVDVTLGHEFDFGVSAAQNPKAFTGSKSTPIVGGGGFNNGTPFVNFLTSLASNGVTSIGTNLASSFANGLSSGSGISYFGNIGPTWDVAVTALQNDSTANIIQRPRIQTSQAKPAQFFVGQTVPYVTSTYNYGGINGNQSSYSQLSVGVELDVTPFINPDGLVVMDVQQEIDSLGDPVLISGNPVFKTLKRTLSSEIAVRDRDTVILGGFVETDQSHAKDGVPFLKDIPILGNLFSKRTDKKNRNELLVLMRPTVLKTPELAAKNTLVESQRLPGVSSAVAADTKYERALVEAERKKEMKAAKSGGNTNGFYNDKTDDQRAFENMLLNRLTNAPAR